MRNTKQYLKLIFIIYLIIIVNLCIVSFGFEEEEETDHIWLEGEIRNVSTNVIDEPKLNSRCAVVFDRSSKTVLFGKNENKRVPMASTTKIMTAIILLENIEKSNMLSLNSAIEVCRQASIVRRI